MSAWSPKFTFPLHLYGVFLSLKDNHLYLFNLLWYPWLSEVARVIMHRTCIGEVSGSILCRDSGYSDWDFLLFCLVCPIDDGIVPQVWPQPFPFISLLGYRQNDRGIGVRLPSGVGSISLLHSVQIGSEFHLTSCPVGTGGMVWPLNSSQWEVECEWSYSGPPQYVFKALWLIENRDK
jgi:hypothetical protein